MGLLGLAYGGREEPVREQGKTLGKHIGHLFLFAVVVRFAAVVFAAVVFDAVFAVVIFVVIVDPNVLANTVLDLELRQPRMQVLQQGRLHCAHAVSLQQT